MTRGSLKEWLRLEDLDRDLKQALDSVVKRYARGNVTFQNGEVMDEHDLDVLRDAGDRSITELNATRDGSGASERATSP